MNSKKSEQDDNSNDKRSVRNTEVTSNSPPKPRKPAQKKYIEVDSEKYGRASNVGPKGTEDPDSDKGPGGTGW
jgi:hypothetical protein